MIRVFTLGYQQLQLEKYIQTLEEVNAGLVLDVRENPWSRKPGFSRKPLQEGLGAAGIEYIHVPSAGNPSDNRKAAVSPGDSLNGYRDHLRSHPGCLDDLLMHIRRAHRSGRPACLTCYEREPSQCHRSILIEAMLKLEGRLEPVHLVPAL